MKKLLIICLLTLSPIFAQNNKNSVKNNNKKTIYPNISYFSITEGLGGVSAVGGGAPPHTSLQNWFNFEFNIPVNNDKVYLYSQLRISFFIGFPSFPNSFLLPIIHMENIKLGALIGLGGILVDYRDTESNRGWYMVMNGGAVIEGAVRSPTPTVNIQLNRDTHLADRFLHFGTELNIKAIYSVNKYQSFSIGMQIGYMYAPYSGDAFYVGLSKSVTDFHMLTYGITIGIHI